MIPDPDAPDVGGETSRICEEHRRSFARGERPVLAPSLAGVVGEERWSRLYWLTCEDVGLRLEAGGWPGPNTYLHGDLDPADAVAVHEVYRRVFPYLLGPPQGSSRWTILGPLAGRRGNHGEILRATDETLGRVVALKAPRLDRPVDPVYRDRLVCEGEILAALDHPGILPIHGMGTLADGRPYLALRLVDKTEEGEEDLERTIERLHSRPGGPSMDRRDGSFRDLIDRLAQIANAAAHAHGRGILHRDLKPSNMMLGRYGEAILIDWGVSKRLPRDGPSSEAAPKPETTLSTPDPVQEASSTDKSSPGTLAYMAPELLPRPEGETASAATVASEVYALGATLYQLLTGRAPVSGDDREAIIALVRRGNIPRPRAVRASVPRALEAICLKAMALAPEDRYATAASSEPVGSVETTPSFAGDLRHWLNGRRLSIPWAEPRHERAARWLGHHPKTVAASFALIVFLVPATTGFTALWLYAKNQQARAVGNYSSALAVIEQLRNYRWMTGSAQSGPDRRRFDKGLAQIASDLAGANSNPAAPRILEAEARHDLARGVRLGTGDARLAAEEAARTVEIYRSLLRDDPQSAKLRSLLASALDDYGIYLQGQGKYAQARDIHHEAIPIRRGLVAANPGDPDSRRALATTHQLIATSYQYENRHQEAETSYSLAIDALGTIAATDLLAWGLSATIRHNRAASAKALDKYDQAEELLREELKIRRRLADECDDPRCREYVADAAASLGSLLHLRNRQKEAAPLLAEARRILEPILRRDPTNFQLRLSVAEAADNASQISASLGRWDEAVEADERAADLYEGLAREQPGMTFAISLGGPLCNLASHTQSGRSRRDLEPDRMARALAAADRAIQALKGPAAVANPHPSARPFLRNSWTVRAQILGGLDRQEEARRSAEQALALDPKFMQARLALAMPLARLGLHNRAATIAESLGRDDPSPATLYNIACVYAAFGGSHRASDPALDYLKRAERSGFFRDSANLKEIDDDPDLDPLRNRQDFRAWRAHVLGISSAR